MVKLRLARGGRKKRPFYKIVAAHSAFQRDGRFLEKVGSYNPLAAVGEEITLKEDRVLYWLMNGARPTDTAHNIFSRKGIMLRYDMLKRGVDEKEIDAAVAEFLKQKEASILKKEEAKEKKRQAKPKAEVKAETAAVTEEATEVAETEPAIEEKTETVAEKVEEVAETETAEVAVEQTEETKTEEVAETNASEEKTEADEEAKSE